MRLCVRCQQSGRAWHEDVLDYGGETEGRDQRPGLSRGRGSGFGVRGPGRAILGPEHPQKVSCPLWGWSERSRRPEANIYIYLYFNMPSVHLPALVYWFQFSDGSGSPFFMDGEMSRPPRPRITWLFKYNIQYSNRVGPTSEPSFYCWVFR